MLQKILIVDDSAVMRKIILKSLNKAGYTFEQVLEAGDGYEALHQLSQSRVDLVISDVNMPNMDGMELLRAIREQAVEPPIPVIMVTTEGTEGKVAEARSCGANGYITKPFAPEQLKRVLEEIFTT